MAGLAAGRYIHNIPLECTECDLGYAIDDLYRFETRVEFGIGIQHRSSVRSFVIAIMPWLVAAHGTPEMNAFIVDSYSQGGGASLVLSLGLGGNLFGR